MVSDNGYTMVVYNSYKMVLVIYIMVYTSWLYDHTCRSTIPTIGWF